MTGFTLAEVDHLLKALNTMSNYDLARAREQIEQSPVDHQKLVTKLEMYRIRIT
jgi:hypothetical protein